jgi:hypothetical protein
MAPKRQSLEAWIRDARNDSEKETPCSAMALLHMRGMREEPIWDTKFKKGGKVWSDKELAEVFQNKAETTVQDLPGSHTFNIHVFYEGNSDPLAKRIIMVHIADEAGGLSTENPTPVGALQQTMRQKEDMFKAMMHQTLQLSRQSAEMVNAMGSMFVQMGRAAAEERNASAAVMRENRESFEIIREMMMKQINENRDHEMKTLEYQRSTEERRKLLGYAPVLVNTLTGREIFPQGTADTVLIEQIASAFDSMGEDQLMGLANSIPPELFGPLMARFTKWKKDKEADDARRRALTPPIRDPAAEAAGDVQPSPLAVRGSASTTPFGGGED